MKRTRLSTLLSGSGMRLHRHRRPRAIVQQVQPTRFSVAPRLSAQRHPWLGIQPAQCRSLFLSENIALDQASHQGRRSIVGHASDRGLKEGIARTQIYEFPRFERGRAGEFSGNLRIREVPPQFVALKARSKPLIDAIASERGKKAVDQLGSTPRLSSDTMPKIILTDAVDRGQHANQTLRRGPRLCIDRKFLSRLLCSKIRGELTMIDTVFGWSSTIAVDELPPLKA